MQETPRFDVNFKLLMSFPQRIAKINQENKKIHAKNSSFIQILSPKASFSSYLTCI